jgi:hypothetical protein
VSNDEWGGGLTEVSLPADVDLRGTIFHGVGDDE